MNAPLERSRDSGFGLGLLLGACVGAGLVLWLAPRMGAEIRQRTTDSARALAQRASEQYRQVGARAGEAVDELTRTGQGIRDDVAEKIARGAHAVERAAMAART